MENPVPKVHGEPNRPLPCNPMSSGCKGKFEMGPICRVVGSGQAEAEERGVENIGTGNAYKPSTKTFILMIFYIIYCLSLEQGIVVLGILLISEILIAQLLWAFLAEGGSNYWAGQKPHRTHCFIDAVPAHTIFYADRFIKGILV